MRIPSLLAFLLLSGSVDGQTEDFVLAEYDGGRVSGSDLHAYLSAISNLSVVDPRGRLDPLAPVEIQIRQYLRDHSIAETARKEVFEARPELGIIVRHVEAEYLRRMLYGPILDEQIAPATPEIEAYYRERHADFRIPAQVRIRHIFTDGRGSETQRQLARQRIEEAYLQLKSGRPFAEVEEEFSDVEVTVQTPSRILTVPLEKVNPIVRQALEELEPGRYGEPVETPYGYEIFLLLDRAPEFMRPLGELADEIRSRIVLERREPARAEMERTVRESIPLDTRFGLLPDNADPDAPLLVVDDEVVTVSDYLALRVMDPALASATDEAVLLEWARVYQAAAYARRKGLHERPPVPERLGHLRAQTIARFFLGIQAQRQYGEPEEEDLREFFQENRDRYLRPMMRSGRRIVLELEGGERMSPPERHAAMERLRARAKALRERSLAGEDFGDLARDHSTAPDASAGGYLASAVSHGPLFDIHTENLAPGEVSDPVERGDRIFLFQLERRLPESPQRFERVRDQVAEDWIAHAREQVASEWNERTARERNLVIHREAVIQWLRTLNPTWNPEADTPSGSG